MTIPSFSLAKATAGHCGTGAVMNILNFFWGTDFDIQDTQHIETMIRFGVYHRDHRPSEFEIALFLAENHFQVEYFSSANTGDFAFFANDPEWHKHHYGYEFFAKMDAASHIRAAQSLLTHPRVTIHESPSQDLIHSIRIRSDTKHAFLFFPDYFFIHHFPNPNNYPWGHIMMSTGMLLQSEDIILYESTPNTSDALFQSHPDCIIRSFSEIQTRSFGHFFVFSRTAP